MKKIRICYFCELWESGGIESFLNNIIKNLDTDIFSIDIIVARMGTSIFTDPLREIGVNFYELSGKLRNPKNYGIFKKLLQTYKYDIIHFNIFHAYAFRYVKIAKNAGIKRRIVHAHGAGLRRSKTRPIKYALHLLGRLLWKKYITHTLACSSVAARFLFGAPADEIIKNGIDTEEFKFSRSKREAVRLELGVGEDPLIGCVGRLSSEKNQGFLIKSFADVLRNIPNAKLLLVGNGPEEAKLRALAKKLNVSDSVIFYGPSSDVSSLMSAMDTFVFPSLFEGLGIVAIEAQASGLPTICSSAVPTDVNITDLVRFVSLDADASEWARVITESLYTSPERLYRFEEVRRAGFDLKDSPWAVLKNYTTP